MEVVVVVATIMIVLPLLVVVVVVEMRRLIRTIHSLMTPADSCRPDNVC
jgi:hypothetical protein